MFLRLKNGCACVVVRTYLTCLFLLCLLPFVARAHTFHTSLTRLEFNPQTKGLEITTQLYVSDLESTLKKANGDKSVDLETAQEADKLILAFLQNTFEIKNTRGEIKKFAWVGKEIKGDMVWLYYEAPMPEGLAGARLHNIIFFNLNDDQLNTVNIVMPGAQSTLLFKSGDDLHLVGARQKAE